MTAPTDDPPVTARPWWRRGDVIGGGVIALVVVVLWFLWRTGNMPADRAEPTATESLAELHRVLAETAELTGVQWEEVPTPGGPFHCTRNDGRSGVSYWLPELVASPGIDADAVLDAAAEHWAGLGYHVDTSRQGGVRAITDNGDLLEAGASHLGATLHVATGCALRE